MVWRDTARFCGAALAVASLALTQPAQAQQGIERVLGGIRLNANSQTVLSRYGNPTQIVVGEVGIRTPGSKPVPAAFAASGMPGSEGAPPSEGPPPGAPGGFSPFPTMPGMTPGMSPGGESGFGAPGAGFGPFGNTQSTLTRSQEVTWIYDRAGISYEFLIGADGRILQIKAIGRGGSANVRTQRGVGLGATYADVVRNYGYAEEYQQVGPILVASYRNRYHASFQFLNGRVIAITISSVE